MRWPWSAPGVPSQRIVVHTDWCIHESAPWPGYAECLAKNTWNLRHLRFHNALNCVRFAIDNDLTWEWPPR